MGNRYVNHQYKTNLQSLGMMVLKSKSIRKPAARARSHLFCILPPAMRLNAVILLTQLFLHVSHMVQGQEHEACAVQDSVSWHNPFVLQQYLVQLLDDLSTAGDSLQVLLQVSQQNNTRQISCLVSSSFKLVSALWLSDKIKAREWDVIQTKPGYMDRQGDSTIYTNSPQCHYGDGGV